MEGILPTSVSASIAIALPPLLHYLGLFKWFDLAYRIVLAELNRYRNQYRYDQSKSRPPPRTMACIVGYREDKDVYEKSLESLRDSKVGTIVVAIDGDDEEDRKMVESFQTVFRDPSAKVINPPISLGKRFIRKLRKAQANGSSAHTAQANGHGKVTFHKAGVPEKQKAQMVAEESAFKEAYDYIRSELRAVGIGAGTPAPQAVCIAQPHCDLKEVRFSAWMVSFVLADMYGYDYLWSTDSDTRVPAETIDTIARVLSSDPSAAAASAYVQLHNAEDTMFSRMASTAWALDTYMNRAALGAMGTSECLHGPSSCFDVARLREVAVPQYLFHYFEQDENTVLNEDIQTTMLLAQRGWKRLYVENCYMLTGGPDTLRAWLGQRLRWSRGINLHRLYDAWYIASQGPLTAWYWLRSGFYDVFVFLWVSWYTFTGQQLFHVTAVDFIILEVLPPIYNFLRCTAPIPSYAASVAMYLVYRAVCPSYRMYTLLTPFGVSWALPKRQAGAKFDLRDFLRREHEALFFVFWVAIAAGALGRLLAGFAGLDSLTTVATSMATAWSATAYGMFVA